MTLLPDRPPVIFTCEVPAKVAAGLIKIAKAKGWRRDILASQMLIAAYSAHHGKGDDEALVESVRGIGSEPAPASSPHKDDTLVHAAVAERDEAKRREIASRAAHQRTIMEHQDLRARLENVEEQSAMFSQTAENLRVQLRDAEAANRLLQKEIAATSDANEARWRIEAMQAEIAGMSATICRLEDRLSVAPAAPVRPQTARADVMRNLICALRAAGNAPSEIARQANVSIKTVNAILKVMK